MLILVYIYVKSNIENYKNKIIEIKTKQKK